MASETAVTTNDDTPVTAVTDPRHTATDTAPDTATARDRAQAMLRNPGLYLGTALGATAAFTPEDPLLLITASTAITAAGWTALALHPGPWRWLPGQGEPWEWMCRSSRRGYRRSVRRMRRRLAAAPELQLTVGDDGLLQPVHSSTGQTWYDRPDRPALLRAATAHHRKTRCETLRTVWANALPDWERGWWRRYSPTEMVLRAGPLVAVPASGLATLPWWAHLAATSAAASWGAWVWHRPETTTPTEPDTETSLHGPDWYLARWTEWIAEPHGPLPESRLASLEVDEDRLTALIVSTTAKPAVMVTQDLMSIAFEVPPRAVNIYRPDDMPANLAKLTVRLRAGQTADLDENDLPAVWHEYTPYVGSELFGMEPTDHGRKFVLQMPRRGSSVADVQPRAIAQALDLPGEDTVSRLHLRVLDARRIEVNEMSTNPLQGGVDVNLNALQMDDQGYITVGMDIYGAPVKWRMLKFDPIRRGLSGTASASAVHAFGSGTTGSGKTSLEEALQIAQRRNGFISWLADGKGGAGYAPWFNDLDWLVKSHFGAMLMGKSANAVSELRYAEQMTMQWIDAEGYTENGRSFFVPGEPFAPLVFTLDEFNEMILKDPQADHVKPLLRSVSSVGRLSRAAGMGARAWVQIPNLDSIGSDASANAIRDMLQSGNIALFRTARSDVDSMSLGSRTPEFRLAPLPERFPDGSDAAGLFYMADGKAQYTQARAMYHSNPARLSRGFPLQTLTDREAEAAGPAYLRREEYRHLDATDEEAFLRDLVKQETAKNSGTAGSKAVVIDTKPATTPLEETVDDEDLDQLVPPSRSELVWSAVDAGARRNKDIATVTALKPTNVAGATRLLEARGQLHKIQREWHTAEPIDA